MYSNDPGGDKVGEIWVYTVIHNFHKHPLAHLRLAGHSFV